MRGAPCCCSTVQGTEHTSTHELQRGLRVLMLVKTLLCPSPSAGPQDVEGLHAAFRLLPAQEGGLPLASLLDWVY